MLVLAAVRSIWRRDPLRWLEPRPATGSRPPSPPSHTLLSEYVRSTCTTGLTPYHASHCSSLSNIPVFRVYLYVVEGAKQLADALRTGSALLGQAPFAAHLALAACTSKVLTGDLRAGAKLPATYECHY